MRHVVLSLLTMLLIGSCGPAAETQPADPAAIPEASGTDIWLFELNEDGLQPVTKVTDRDGYDNQPSFGPDGRLLFTSDRDGNYDSFVFDPQTGETFQLTQTVEGEYSPTVMPGELVRWFSVIRMDTAGVQELWQYPLDPNPVPARVADIDRVGYHTWVGAERVLFFRLGSPNSLQLVTVGTADTTVVARNVGRSLHRIPGDFASSYSLTLDDGSREIRRYDWVSGESTGLAVPLEGSQDYAWTPDGAIIMAADGELFSYKPGASVDWESVGDTGLSGITRLAVSPDGRYVAVVGER